MKKFLTVIAILISLFLSLPSACWAETQTLQTVSLKRKPKDHTQETNPIGTRQPAAPVVCFISQWDFHSNINPTDILSYEIWDDANSMCFASFSEQLPFCQYLFQNPNTYQITINTIDHVYIGFISTL